MWPATARLVEKFLSRLEERITAIRAAADTEDRAQLKTLAHQLKGAAGGYGYPQISEAAKTLEHATDDDISGDRYSWPNLPVLNEISLDRIRDGIAI